MNTVDVLRQAKAILSDESRWCRTGPFAVNSAGEGVSERAPDAVAFCALGAIHRFKGLESGYYDEPERALVAAIGLSDNWTGTFVWNDKQTTHEQLIDAFDRAILSLAGSAKLAPLPKRVEVPA